MKWENMNMIERSYDSLLNEFMISNVDLYGGKRRYEVSGARVDEQ